MAAQLGKYEVNREIGRGGMGVVYQAYDPYIDRQVAVKVAMADALKERNSGDRFRKMFFNEAHTAGMLRHPNILDIFDAGVDEDKCYIGMELIEHGDTLRSYTNVDNLLPLNQVAELVFRCAKALDYAHRQGVIHRDIKPSNILLTQEMDVKIADFSIAHINRTDLSQTMPMGFVGSPRYMSPEQIQEDSITHQTDLFSLGIVAYELLTGHHPFGGESFSNLIHRVINEEPTPLATFRPDLPPILDRIIIKCLEKSTDRRYRMGLDLASDLSMAFTHLERPQENIPAREKFELVKPLDFFRGFPDSEIWEIIRASVWQDAAPGEAVIKEGDIDDSFFIIIDGAVNITKQSRMLSRLKSGDCFGEMGYLNKTRRSATVTADGHLALMKVNATLIEQVSLECQLRFSRVFLRVLSDRLAKTTDLVVRGG
ncbi:MAG: cyclic nucleotide-binding domain-containing protein [Gammaproteobacteria bacterium]|nr:cyclic nucleotide-binding domain-containing protein [Gammaproteobacteria bacterium]